MKIYDKFGFNGSEIKDIENHISRAFTDAGKKLEWEDVEISMTLDFYNYFVSHGYSMWIKQRNVDVIENWDSDEISYMPIGSVLISSDKLEEDILIQDYLNP